MPTTDFNGDGRDDIFLRDRETDWTSNWLGQPDGSLIFNEEADRDPFAIGHFVGVGDFNMDGRTDTLMRDGNGGLHMSLTFPGGAFYFVWSTGYVASVPTSWNVAGTGDFNGDGRDDIIWRNDNGAFSEWLAQPPMNGWVDFISNHQNASTVMPTSWQVAGTGDFNGDGRDDVLWRHESGLVNNWFGQPDGGFVSNAKGWANPGADWQVAGIGDFNGDGRADVIWRNDNGAFSEWLAQADGSFASNHEKASTVLPLDWRVAGTGDYNGDGRDDVLWRHESGLLNNWLGQEDGGFVSNPDAWIYVPPNWLIQPNPSGAGFWDY